MKELFFHLGTPKTGSSALQVFLARNAELLRSRSVDYLQIGEFGLGMEGRISSGNGAFVARSLFPASAGARMKEPDRYIAEFHDAVLRSEAEIGIISSEMFVDVEKESLDQLCNNLRKAGVKPRAAYFIRSQVQSLCSAYMQRVKRHGCTDDAEHYVTQVYRHIPFLKHFSFYKWVCDIFEPGNVLCRTYDLASSKPDGLFHTFINAVSVSSTGLDMNVCDVNTSLSPREIAIMLVLNRFKPLMKFSDTVVENAAQFGSASSGQLHNLLPASLVEEIETYFASENATLAETYFHRQDLFPDRGAPGKPEHISVNDLTTQDLVEFFGGLLVRYDERLAKLERSLERMRPRP